MKHEIQMLSEQLQNVRLEVEGAIAIVTMARPKAMNALNIRHWASWKACFTISRRTRIFSV